MGFENHKPKVIFTYMGTSFVLEPYSDGYHICGMDLAAEDIWFPDNYMGKRIMPWVSLNQCSNSEIPWFHHFDNVRRLHIPDWMSYIDTQNYLFPKLEEIDIHPSPAHPKMSSFGPLLISGSQLNRVFSVGYMECFTFPQQIKSVGDSAFAYTTITDISFENPLIEFDRNAFVGSRINQLIQNREKQFIVFGSLLYRCVYIDSRVLKIPDHIRSFDRKAFEETYVIRPDGGKDWTESDYPEEIESPVHIPFHVFKSVKKYCVHSFDNRDIENLRRMFPNMEWLDTTNKRDTEWNISTHFVTCQGVLFTKDMKTLVIYPKIRNSEYTVPDGVTHIANSAFKDNPWLKKVHLPESIISIGTQAFDGTGIVEIQIPAGTREIGWSALHGIAKIHCFDGTAKGLFRALLDMTKNDYATIDMIRSDGTQLQLRIPAGLNEDGLKALDRAWSNPPFDIHEYQKCYAYFDNHVAKYRFAYEMYRVYGKESASTEYLKRISLKFAQHLISEKAEDELIGLLDFGIMKAPTLRKLLEYVQDKNMPTINAYILETLNTCEKDRKTLRL